MPDEPQGPVKGGGRRKPSVLPLPPVTGNLWVPVWAIRPGSYEVLESVVGEMPLWLLIHSRNADHWRPCYASREQFVATIGGSVRNLTRQIGRLREAGLLFEVARGEEPGSRRHRPPARWALDPFTADIWGAKWDNDGGRLVGQGKVEMMLAEIAEADGQSRPWLQRAVRELDDFERASRYLAERIAADMPIQPKKRRKRKRRKKKQTAMSHLAPRATMAHEGIFISTQSEQLKQSDNPVVDGSQQGPVRSRPEDGRDTEPEGTENIGRSAASDDERNAA